MDNGLRVAGNGSLDCQALDVDVGEVEGGALRGQVTHDGLVQPGPST